LGRIHAALASGGGTFRRERLQVQVGAREDTGYAVTRVLKWADDESRLDCGPEPSGLTPARSNHDPGDEASGVRVPVRGGVWKLCSVSSTGEGGRGGAMWACLGPVIQLLTVRM